MDREDLSRNKETVLIDLTKDDEEDDEEEEEDDEEDDEEVEKEEDDEEEEEEEEEDSLEEMIRDMTCVICSKIYRNATGITVCQHKFCWDCIYGKIAEHDWTCCPVCYAKFGNSEPLRNLRFDPVYNSLARYVLFKVKENAEKEPKRAKTSQASSSSSSRRKM
ncbi:unnamed protein product [Microthlaspi erraticum]|uniref:RING-type domain-containing protein n=1 Tax=Microthlaspi erraticum TaxID=1685480 RepID=A0A6D2IKG2_9BRAS|nr:unnamed protein product [Microthlaspi erraticum]